MKTAFITGASKGIGLAFAQRLAQAGWRVFATCRQPNKAYKLQQLQNQYENVHIHVLDVTKDEDIQALSNSLSDQSIDLLINNAGISGEEGVTVGHINRTNFLKVVDVNVLGALKVSEAFLSHVEKSGDKLIVAISSRMGSIADNTSGKSYAYRSSKAALNCAIRSFAIDVAQRGVNVVLFHPGWVKTDMGGTDGQIEADTSVQGMLEQLSKLSTNSHAEVLRRYDGDTIPW